MMKKRITEVPVNCEITENMIKVTVEQDTRDAYLEFGYDFQADGTEYVLFPSCCYAGNQFKVLKKMYPPMFRPEEASVDMPVTITDVPRLNEDGSGKIEVTTGDVSVPCVGVFSKTQKKAILLYTIQEIEGVNLGLSYEKGKISLTWPHMRKESIYRWPFMTEKHDPGKDFVKGQVIEIPYRIFEFGCESMEAFYQIYFETRKCMRLADERPQILSFEEQFEILKDKFNAMNWREPGKFYGVGTDEESNQTWQPGWVGGGMSSYALMKLGGELEWQRGIHTLEHIFHTQASGGFLYENSDAAGNVGDMGFEDAEWIKPYHLIRKSADVLYYLFKHYELMKAKGTEIPKHFVDGTKKLADAFVNMWEKYGQFGQFVNLDTNEIIAGGSTSAAIVPAGLVKAYEFFGDEKYLEIAKASAEYYYARDARNGYTTGGPGEILQGPDSESAFALLESMVVLYEAAGEEKWLDYAKHTANLCSSWVVAYNYHFPKKSEFGRLDMKTTGCVFANVQNKHAGPGACTISCNSLYKLYKWTEDERYLELLKDIALSISQFMSTEKRPIYSCDWNVFDGTSEMDEIAKEQSREKLPQGFICERVNMSDWEGECRIGEVFFGSCWSETSCLLTLAETVPLLENKR